MSHRAVLHSSAALVAGCASGALAAGAVAVASPSPATAEPIGAELAAAIERYRAALAVEQAALEARRPFEWAEFDRAKPSADARAAFESADEAFQSAAEVTFDAIDDIAAVPIHTLADMRAKAAFLSAVMPRKCSDYNDTVAALLASMGGAAEGSDLTCEPDPLATLVEEYRVQLATYNASGDLTSAEDDALAAATWRPAYAVLCKSPPAATTLAGALTAIRLAVEDLEGCADAEFVSGLNRAALAYFDGRA